MEPKSGRLHLLFSTLVFNLAIVGIASEASSQSFHRTPIVQEQGAGPVLNDVSTKLPNGSPTSGAINAIVASPFSPDVVYVGAVSGGVWMTLNAQSSAPYWIPLTDKYLPELPISSLAISPIFPWVIFAGTGNTSSFDRFGNLGIGVARSLDGGKSWKVLGKEIFTGQVITSIVPTKLNFGKVILASTWNYNTPMQDREGVFRSIDNGETFERISGNESSKLPNAGVSSLVADSSDPKVFYAAVPQIASGSGKAEVFRSNDGGVTWQTASVGIANLTNSYRILLTVHNSLSNGVPQRYLFAANFDWHGNLIGVFASSDSGSNWQSLPLPMPPVITGRSGEQHAAFAADPRNPGVLFIAGDDEAEKNDVGCTAYNAPVYRFDLKAWLNNKNMTWQSVVCDNAGKTWPHADARFISFDAVGNLLLAGDGGIAKLINPNNVPLSRLKRQWVSVVGNLRIAEFHSAAYDSFTNTLVAGSQDLGSPYQLAPNSFAYNQFSCCDGGYVAVDSNQTLHPGVSFRYMSSYNLGGFTQTSWNSRNQCVSQKQVCLQITQGDGAPCNLIDYDNTHKVSWFQPFAINSVDPNRMLIGADSIYESMTRGDTLKNIHSLNNNFTGCDVSLTDCNEYGQPISYGGYLNGTPYPDVFYLGANDKIFHRKASGGIVTLDNYKGGTIETIVVNPQNYRHLFVVDKKNQIQFSADEGDTWVNLTGNLPALTRLVLTIETGDRDPFTNLPTLYAGGFGVFRLIGLIQGQYKWEKIVPDVNPALVADLRYDRVTKILTAGTMGRGAWTYCFGDVAKWNVADSKSTVTSVSACPAMTTTCPSPPSSCPAPQLLKMGKPSN